MPELRARKHHKDRVAETMREEISTMVLGELSDPRISFAYVSEVVLAPGGNSARIFVAIDGGAEEEQQTLAALNAARGHIRHELMERMGVRHVPELDFQADRSQNLRARIDELMGRTKRGRKNAMEETAGPSGPEGKDERDV